MRAFRLAFLAACLCPAAAWAQSLWPRTLEGAGDVGVEWVRPTFATGDAAYGFGRGVWIFDARLRIGERSRLVVALPWIEPAGGGEGGSAMGNAMLGIEFADTLGRPEFTLGFRRGHLDSDGTKDGASELALFGDIDRVEQAFSTGLIIEGVANVHPGTGVDRMTAEIRLGATAVLGEGGGTFFMKYGARLGYDVGAVNVGGGLTGLWLVPDGVSTGGTIDQLFGEITTRKGTVRPSLAVRFPLDKGLSEDLSFAVTAGVRVILK